MKNDENNAHGVLGYNIFQITQLLVLLRYRMALRRFWIGFKCLMGDLKRFERLMGDYKVDFYLKSLIMLIR